MCTDTGSLWDVLKSREFYGEGIAKVPLSCEAHSSEQASLHPGAIRAAHWPGTLLALWASVFAFVKLGSQVVPALLSGESHRRDFI